MRYFLSIFFFLFLFCLCPVYYFSNYTKGIITRNLLGKCLSNYLRGLLNRFWYSNLTGLSSVQLVTVAGKMKNTSQKQETQELKKKLTESDSTVVCQKQATQELKKKLTESDSTVVYQKQEIHRLKAKNMELAKVLKTVIDQRREPEYEPTLVSPVVRSTRRRLSSSADSSGGSYGLVLLESSQVFTRHPFLMGLRQRIVSRPEFDFFNLADIQQFIMVVDSITMSSSYRRGGSCSETLMGEFVDVCNHGERQFREQGVNYLHRILQLLGDEFGC